MGKMIDDRRNFLFFLNEVNPVLLEDLLIGSLAVPSSWDALRQRVTAARQNDAFVSSVKKVQLYIHVPYCGRLCTFCHCAHSLLRRRSDIDRYVQGLKHQMNSLAPAFKGMDSSMLFFGGGTPSILDAAQISSILDGVDDAFPFPERKILFEANPSSWTSPKLAALASRGLYYLSIGVQSLDEKVLKRTARSQTREKVLWCLHSARRSGIPYVNVDLIAGLPGQTVKGIKNDLQVLLNEGANSVHVYPYCSFSLKELSAPQEKVPAFVKRRDDMMNATRQILEEAGFRRNGVFGAYTFDGQGEDHQEEAYTRVESAVAAFGPWVKGQFPGAVFYRTQQSKTLEDVPLVEAHDLDISYTMGQYAMLAVFSGLDEKIFLNRFGLPLKDSLGKGLRCLQQQGLVKCSKGVWKFSGSWDVRRIYEYVALSRILFGEDLLLRLRQKYQGQYDPRHDYYGGRSLLKAYSNGWLMVLYYQMGL